MNVKKFARAATAALLTLALALAGCGYNPETVMTIDGESVPAGRWLYFQRQALLEAVTELDDVTVNGVDVLERDIDGAPAREYIRAKTIDACKRYLFIEREFERLGLAFEQGELDNVKGSAETNWQYISGVFEQNGIGYDSFLATFLNYMKETKVREKLFGEGGELEVSSEDKQAYFNDNFAQYEYFTLPATSSIGYNMLEYLPDETRELAARMLEKAESDGITAAYLELYGEALALAQSPEMTVDEASADAAVSSALISKALGYSDELCDAVLAVPVGGFGVAEADGSVYVFKRVALPTDISESDYDASIVSALSEAPFDEYIQKGDAAYEVVADEKALSYYSPDKVVVE